MHVQPLFPAFLCSETLEPGVVDNDRLCEIGYKLKAQHDVGIFQGGFQTPDLHPNLPEATDLLDIVRDRAEGIWTRLLNGLPTHTTHIAEWWINIQEPGADCFPPHVHKNQSISFVYYPRATENAGSINFICPFQGMEYALPLEHMADKNMYTSPRWEIKPTTGLLIAFPGYLMHWVENNHSQGDRVSIAFNIEIKAQDETK